ncbi:flagellar biosynthetic protein FliO [Enterocloster sp. OA13]|uniref:flagellar biosynthetic protein FliO n=1 Tax=Enterocloster sp. OA13 TaxID=2914161 RepID=UPI0004B6305B|nr:flagellar biosynthetic protein FliO [Enterocloster sp. OA13]
MMDNSFLSLAGAVLTVGCILLLAYWCSRLMGKTYMKATSGRNLKILEQVRIGADKQILLVRLRSHMYLIGVSQAGIQMLEKLEEEYGEPEEREETNE